MADNKNYILAIVLSVFVLFGWQYFIAQPQIDAERARLAVEAQRAEATGAGTPNADTSNIPGASAQGTEAAPSINAQTAGQLLDRAAAIANSTRLSFENAEIKGSIDLNGARIDDLVLKSYDKTLEDNTPVVLLSPSGTQDPYYADFGWVSPNTNIVLPTRTTLWSVAEGETLTPTTPVTLTYDNGQGLVFKRVLSLDENYMFGVTDSVENTTANDIVLTPYALVARHSLVDTQHYALLHEGFIAVVGEEGLMEVQYSEVEEADTRSQSFAATDGWLGITDKYWATTLIPADVKSPFSGRFLVGTAQGRNSYQADYVLPTLTLPANGSVETSHLLFAGAKEVPVINGYEADLGIDRFELLIDWGWLYFITKPMFKALKFFADLTGNFGIAILIVTFLIKVFFFPLSNKSYASMSRMKKVQPEIEKLRDRAGDDKMKLQQGMMELYKREKINPVAGCLPMLIQIPVFFGIYKVLLVTIEMRHAPFFGWIQDLSVQDPTSVFNLFGIFSYDPTVVPLIGTFLGLGAWPLLMGITMFIQMKLNPAPPDPTQRMIFDFMPIIFTFLLATFPAGLVIYWTWNNFLTILQQGFIMRRQGVEIDMWGNIKNTFRYGKKKA